jgi:hypothetical protein
MLVVQTLQRDSTRQELGNSVSLTAALFFPLSGMMIVLLRTNKDEDAKNPASKWSGDVLVLRVCVGEKREETEGERERERETEGERMVLFRGKAAYPGK